MAVLFSGKAKAMEEKPQMGVSLNAGRELGAQVNLQFNMCFINLMTGHAPYTSLGLNYKFNDRFNLSGYFGYGFEELEEDRGWFVGIDPVFRSGDWVFANGVYYYAGFDVLFSYHSLSYPLGFTRVGIDARNYHYLAKADEASRSYQVGPAIFIPFNDKFSLKLNYYYAFEPYGESAMDANVYKATLIYNF